jgi:hypothetical protein
MYHYSLCFGVYFIHTASKQHYTDFLWTWGEETILVKRRTVNNMYLVGRNTYRCIFYIFISTIVVDIICQEDFFFHATSLVINIVLE